MFLIYSSRLRLLLLTSLEDMARFVCAKNTSDFHLKILMQGQLTLKAWRMWENKVRIEAQN